jgi:hypothetical protein
MFLLLWGQAGEGPGGALELRQHALVACLKPPLLGGPQLRRDLEGGQVHKRLADLLQAPFQFGGLR